MKRYYSVGAIIALIIFVFWFCLMGIQACGDYNYNVKEIESQVTLRYYLNDDFENAEVVMKKVKLNSQYSISELPQKDGYVFAGLYDGTDIATSKCYVDSEGTGLIYLTQDTLLYPIFSEV